jgi:hypothetical protein
MTIVTTTYRYKRPPKRKGRKLAEITGPAVVTAKGSRRPVGVGETAAESEESARSERTGDTKPSTPSGKVPAPANDDRKSAIVTAQKPSSWHSDVPDMTEEEHRRRGDAADALFREMKLRIAGALPPKKP